ncbi:MAG: hypothetical protein ACK5LC_17925 [Coprobacillaceae bacterium]
MHIDVPNDLLLEKEGQICCIRGIKKLPKNDTVVYHVEKELSSLITDAINNHCKHFILMLDGEASLFYGEHIIKEISDDAFLTVALPYYDFSNEIMYFEQSKKYHSLIDKCNSIVCWQKQSLSISKEGSKDFHTDCLVKYGDWQILIHDQNDISINRHIALAKEKKKIIKEINI